MKAVVAFRDGQGLLLFKLVQTYRTRFGSIFRLVFPAGDLSFLLRFILFVFLLVLTTRGDAIVQGFRQVLQVLLKPGLHLLGLPVDFILNTHVDFIVQGFPQVLPVLLKLGLHLLGIRVDGLGAWGREIGRKGGHLSSLLRVDG
jgi:hypothetical protein